MRTDLVRRLAMYLLCLLTAISVLAACGSKSKTTESGNSGTVPSVTTSAEDSTAFGTTSSAVVHFPSFELEVPADWSVRGNVGKVCEGDDMFLLVGPVDGTADTATVEAALAEELELFFNTEYYRSQVRFEYEKEYTDGAMHRLSGTLHNDRNGSTLRFAGAFGTAPGMYCYYFWPDASRDRDGNRLMEAGYESIRIL